MAMGAARVDGVPARRLRRPSARSSPILWCIGEVAEAFPLPRSPLAVVGHVRARNRAPRRTAMPDARIHTEIATAATELIHANFGVSTAVDGPRRPLSGGHRPPSPAPARRHPAGKPRPGRLERATALRNTSVRRLNPCIDPERIQAQSSSARRTIDGFVRSAGESGLRGSSGSASAGRAPPSRSAMPESVPRSARMKPISLSVRTAYRAAWHGGF